MLRRGTPNISYYLIDDICGFLVNKWTKPLLGDLNLAKVVVFLSPFLLFSLPPLSIFLLSFYRFAAQISSDIAFFRLFFQLFSPFFLLFPPSFIFFRLFRLFSFPYSDLQRPHLHSSSANPENFNTGNSDTGNSDTCNSDTGNYRQLYAFPFVRPTSVRIDLLSTRTVYLRFRLSNFPSFPLSFCLKISVKSIIIFTIICHVRLDCSIAPRKHPLQAS